MATNDLLTLVGLFGALQALLLAAATWWGRRRDEALRGQTRLLALLFVILALVVASISVDHAGWLEGRVPLDWIEYCLSLLAPPVFLAHGRSVVGRPTGRRWWLAQLLPLGLWLGWTALGGGVWQIRDWPLILLVVGYQVAITVRVGALAFSASSSAASGLPMLRAWVLGLALVHAAQVARIAFRRVESLDEVVPVTATVVLYGLVLFALRSARLLRPPPPPYAASGLSPEDAEGAAARIEELLVGQELFLDPDLDLETLAARARLSRGHASQAINQVLGTTFPELVGRHRVEAARSLLADPAHDHVTVDAVGQRAGFSSRSSFYEAFRRHTGETPGRFRAARDS